MNCILFFLRHPEPGKVKTRLAKEYGDQAACDLYRAFILDEMDTFAAVEADLRIFGSPAKKTAAIRQWLGAGPAYHAQKGRGLGERMRRAFEEAFDIGCTRAVCIGSDLPDIPKAHVTEALEALEQKDVVLGPAKDGGYYLIGFRPEGFVPEIFENMRWSRPDVLKKTIERLDKAEKAYHLLPEWHDVDTADDLSAYLERNAKSTTHTTKALKKIKAG